MKILYFVNSLNDKSGIPRIVVDKANYLADFYGHNVTICILQGDLVSAYDLSSDVKFVRLIDKQVGGSTVVKKIKGIFSIINKLRQRLIIEQPDVVVNAHTSLLTWILPFVMRRIPKVMEIHLSRGGMRQVLEGEGKAFQMIYWFLIDWFYARFDRFVVLTPEDKKNWKQKNVEVIGNFTQLHDTKIASLDNRKIICVARYHRIKRLDLLIEAWALISKNYPGWELNIYGKGADKEKLLELVKERGLSQTIHMNDACHNITEKYLESSISVLTSEHEGFALVLLEAMQLGLPVCAMDVDGIGGLVENEKSGLLSPFGDVKAFATNLERLINSKNLRVSLRDGGLRKAKEYSKETIMEKWNSLFTQIVNHKS